MDSKAPVFIGIDPGIHLPLFTWAVLDVRLNVLGSGEGSLEDVLAAAGQAEAAWAAVNAPQHTNCGLVQRTSRRGRKPTRSLGQITNLRLVEDELQRSGIRVPHTPAALEDCPRWMQAGFACYKGLEELGYTSFPGGDAPRQRLEVNSEAAFHALLKQPLLPARSLEGRIQRHLVLFEHKINVRDPMNFFEEVTRHRFLSGVLPLDLLYSNPQINALMAAFTAWLANQKPVEVMRLGAAEEGQMVLPAWEELDRVEKGTGVLQPSIF
jgi:hypothetical protein